MIKRGISYPLTLVNSVIILLLLATAFAVMSILWIKDKQTQFEKEASYLKESYIVERQSLIRAEVESALQFIDYQETLVDERLSTELESRINEAHSIATNIYEKFNGIEPEATIKRMIEEALRDIRFFDGRGYFYVYDMQGFCRIHGANPALESTMKIWNFIDSQGNYPLRDIIDTVSKDGKGYVSFYFFRPDSTEQEPKLSYNIHFEPYDWVIGTGEYEREITNEIQKETIRRLREIRYAEDGYLFIYDKEGDSIMHPIIPEMEGNNYRELVDPTGKLIFQEMLKAAELEDPGFTNYLWSHPGLGDNLPKVAYAKIVEQWNWMIGSGLYMHEIDQIIQTKRDQLRKDINRKIRNILFFVFLSSLIFISIIKIYTDFIKKSFLLFSSFFEKAAVDNSLIDTDKVHFSEFKKLGELANSMLQTQNEAQEELQSMNQKFASAMEESSKQRDYFQNIIDSSPIIFFTKDRNSVYQQVNKAYEKSSGNLRSSIIGKSDHEIFSESFYKSWKDQEQIAIESAQEVIFEMTVPDPVSGEEKTYIQIFNTFENENKDDLYLIGWAIDISDRKAAEHRLEERESRLSALVSALPDMTFLQDENGFYLEAFIRNDQVEEAGTLEGSSSVDELIGKSVHDFFDLETADSFVEVIQQSLKNHEISSIEYELDATIGHRHYEARIAPTIIEGGKKAVLWVARDVTELKQLTADLENAKLEMEQINRSMNAMVDALPDLIFIKDEDGIYLDTYVREEQLHNVGYLEGMTLWIGTKPMSL